MNDFAQEFDAAGAEDPTQQLLDAVRETGPAALAELLGDQGFLLAELATDPGGLFTTPGATSDQYSAVIKRLQEQRAAMDALETRAMVGHADATRAELRAEELAQATQEADAAESEAMTEIQAENSTTRDVSMSTRRAPATASRTLAAARRLVDSMPEMLTAMATGRLTATSARSTATSLGPLTPAQREHVDAILGARLAELDSCGSEQWNGAVAAAIAEADPDGEAKRHHHARRHRSVTVRRGQNGMATIRAHVPALAANTIRKRLSLEAERLRATGDRRGHQQIQADSFVDTLLGAEDGMDRTDLDIGVIITDRALLDPQRGDLAHIEGYGPVPAESVREDLRGPLRALSNQAADELDGDDGAAAHLALRRLYTHPTTGELVAVESVAREFPKGLARFIRWRDQICRGPHCNAPIRQSDHIRPHAAGGHTFLDNGQGLCAFCNDKENQTSSVERDRSKPGHRVRWTSRNGTTRTTGAARFTAPVEMPDTPDVAPDASVETAPGPDETESGLDETAPGPGETAPASDETPAAPVNEPSAASGTDRTDAAGADTEGEAPSEAPEAGLTGEGPVDAPETPGEDHPTEPAVTAAGATVTEPVPSVGPGPRYDEDPAPALEGEDHDDTSAPAPRVAPRRRPAAPSEIGQLARHRPGIRSGTRRPSAPCPRAGIRRRSHTAWARAPPGQADAAAFAAPGSASAIRSSTSGVWAVETNQASKADGGRYTPASSIAWKNRVNAAVSCTFASS